MTFPAEDVLDALELSAEAPSHSFLQRVFARFNGRVSFETVSKILRNQTVAYPPDKPRVPDVFWSDFLEHGTGGTCFARVAAFDVLLRHLGFETRKAIGRVEADFDHAALFVEAGGREWIADVGFPLPDLLPAGGGEVEAATSSLAAVEGGRGLEVRFTAGVPEGPRRLEVFRERVSEEEFLERWRATFRPDSRFLTAVFVHRSEASRIVRFARGEVRVDDLHSRTRIPLSGDRPRRVAEIFDLDPDVVRRAFAIAGDPDPEISDARITAYLSVPSEPGAAFEAIASPTAYRELMSGVADVSGEGWRLRLSPPGAPGAGFEEEIRVDESRRSLEARRRYSDGRTATLAFRVEVRDGETYLVREAALAGAREDLLANDSARGRMAGTLAADLLGWARMV